MHIILHFVCNKFVSLLSKGSETPQLKPLHYSPNQLNKKKQGREEGEVDPICTVGSSGPGNNHTRSPGGRSWSGHRETLRKGG